MAKNDCILLDGIIDDRIAEKLPSTKRDEAFEFFAFEQILKDLDLTPEEILSGSIDGRGDGGIDGFFILINGHILDDPEAFTWPRTGSELKVVIITCKHHETFKQATLDSLVASLGELLDFGIEDLSLKGAYSDNLIRFRNNFKSAYRKLSPRLTHFSIEMHYASRGDTESIGTEVQARGSQLEQLAKDLFGSCKPTFTFIGSTELIELHRKKPNYTLELPFVEALAKGERYVVLARLSDYYNFISDSGKLRRYLFESNVRDFVGLNRVNEDIKSTLENADSPDFWLLNNGVTILATSASIIGKSIQADDIQIVNGLQTTESIFRYFQSGGTLPDDRSVLVKVIVSRDSEVRDSIIRATNNQTDVELVSLHATDKIQHDIEEVLLRNSLYYDRRKNYYANQGHSANEIVSPLYIAGGYISLSLKLPHLATTLRAKFMRHPDAYNSVFSSQAPIEVWPKIAKVLKATDGALELLRPSSKSTDRFLKGWRHIIAFLIVSNTYKRYTFTAADLIAFDEKIITMDEVRRLMEELDSYNKPSKPQLGWGSRRNVLSACATYASKNSITGIEMLTNQSNSLTLREKTAHVRPSKFHDQLTDDFLSKVKSSLPPQPWKPGTLNIVAKAIGSHPGVISMAITRLTEEGALYRQKDGVLFDKDGNVAGFDTDRVDPTTLKLIDPT